MLRLAALAATSIFAVSAYASPLFKYKGKTYEAKDLTPGQQQTLHDLQSENHMRLEAFVEQAILDLHIEEEVKRTGKTRDQVEDQLVQAKEPTDKEIKDWYEANKHRLPPGYELDKIRADIKNLLKQEGKKKARDEVIAKVRKDAKVELAFQAPVAPSVTIATDGFPAKGAATAKVTLVEFADYQCPHCKAAGEVVQKILKKYDGKVRLVFVDFPINPSGISLKVAHGAVCAEQQGKYWEYHDLAFAKQKDLEHDSPSKLAKELKLDETKFAACMNSDAPIQRVEKGRAEGDRIGVSGTPAIYVNGRRVRGYEEAELEAEIKKALGQSV